MTQAEYKTDQLYRLNTLLSITPMADISAVMNKYGETRTAITAESLYNAMQKYGSAFAADLRTIGYKAMESPEFQRIIKAYPTITDAADGESASSTSSGDGTKAKNIMQGIAEMITAIGSTSGVILSQVDTTGTAATDATTRQIAAQTEYNNSVANLESAESSANAKTIIIVAVVIVVLAVVVTGIMMAVKKR